MSKLVSKITDRDVDFAKWYTDVVREADLVAYSSVKGSMIIRPYGYAIWENIQRILDKELKKTGHENVQMPMFIPESLLNVEKEHVNGFAPEVAWVTHGGNEKLEERMCVRPTSEVLFCEHYKNIIKSYRDLPKLYNQWCTIVRWEKTTRPFLRSREILWQEGHTMHKTSEEAKKETLRMLKIYEDFQRNILDLPVLVGRKTEKEKFAGAEETYTLEAMMYDGVALQNGTSHYFGNHFAKAFGIQFLDENNTLQTPYQTSWGVSTRMIGGIIMTHGDNHGLVLPPNIAPIKIIFIPITQEESILNTIDEIIKKIPEEYTYKIDDSDKSPGYKFAEAEVKGIPIRVEVGKRDLENDEVTVVRRDTLEKYKVKTNEVADYILKLLETIQKDMYDRALQRRNEKIFDVKDYDDMKELIKEKTGFIKINWCGKTECEEQIKNDTGYKSRCIIEEEKPTGKCIVCGQEATCRIYVGKQY